MLDLRLIRQDPEAMRARLGARGRPEEMDRSLAALLALDEERRARIGEGDEAKSRRNAVSQEVAERKRRGESADALIAEMRAVNERIRAADTRLREVEQALDEILLRLPNPTDPSVPAGGEEANTVVRSWGEPRQLPSARPHWELGAELGILDLPGGARVAGSGFPAYRGLGARLQRGLINFFLDLHTREHGDTEVEPPFLVTREAMQGTGQYPKFVEDGDAYEIAGDGLYLVPTSEVPLVNLLRDQLLEAAGLPVAFTAYSPCFRREAGAAGKDTRGLLRLHQFDKVELVRVERPERSWEVLETMTAQAERALQLLELPYRVLLLATGDTGFASAKTYDLEVWAPGVGKWLEVSSASNCTDFQARRANIRFRPEPGAKPEFAHTLNASGLALPRTVVALLENGQQDDGSVLLPAALHPYVGTDRLTRA